MADTAIDEVDKGRVCIVGAGTMGAGIAATFAAHGYDTTVYSRTTDTLDRARAVVSAHAPEVPVRYSTDLADSLRDAQFVSENVAEDLDLKLAFFNYFEALTDPDCLLTTNTSSISVSTIAKSCRRPDRIVGLHWFNPAPVMPLVEVIRGDATSDETIRRCLDLCQKIGKETIVVNSDVPGFVVNRLQYALLREALHLVQANVATMADVDRAVSTTLAPRWSASGPLELMDLAGLDVVRNVSTQLMPHLSVEPGVSPIVADLVAAHALGVKTGRGFYDWTPERAAATAEFRDRMVTTITTRQAGRTAPSGE